MYLLPGLLVDRRLPRWLAAAMCLALAGCGGAGDDAAPGVGDGSGGGGGGAGVPTAPSTMVDYAAAAQPLRVTPVLEAAAIQELDVTLAGATLAVTGGNGSRYTLVVPADALRSPTRIRMQAVSALTGAPAGIAAVHGVQLEPAGLHFIAAATLTIEPAVTVPLAQQAFYSYDAAGADLHPVNSELGAAAQLKVWHFSGYGMATLEREKSVSGVFVNVVPAGLEARLRSAMAAAFMRARDGTLTAEQLAVVVDALLTQYETEVLKPMRDAAGRSCANAITSFTADLSNARQRQVLGIGGGDLGDALETMKTLRSVCFDESDKRCRVSGNIEQLIVDHRGLEHQAQSLGADDPAATAREETAIDKCGRYEFQFDSTASYDGKGAPNSLGFGSVSVVSRVPIKLAASFESGLEGEAEITHAETLTRINCAGVGCGYAVIKATHPDTAQVKMGLPRFTPLQGIDVWALGQPVSQAGTFSVAFDPRNPSEDIDAVVDVGPPIGLFETDTPIRTTLWSGAYSLVNQNEIGPDGFYAWASDWTQVAYPVMFERSKAPSFENQQARYVAITKARLVHKPI